MIDLVLTAILAFVSGMFFIPFGKEVLWLYRHRQKEPIQARLIDVVEGRLPTKTEEVSTGSAVSTIRLFERQNEMEKRIKRLETLLRD